ncbi:MAG: hypothetical protein PF487_08005 [Bacteroidales bacterium]|jgi:hypothetical protein|nr:hypothetical protein [Bacteroidales bacterium]
MPLIRIENEQGIVTPRKLADNFKNETNLDLHIFLENDELTSSNTPINKIWEQHPILKHLSNLLQKLTNLDFLSFYPNSNLLEIKKKLSTQFAFEFSFSYKGKILKDKSRISDYKTYSEDAELLPELYELNEKLIEITTFIKVERKKSKLLFNELKEQIGNRYEVDYEPEYRIKCILKETDPLYDPEMDNILCSITDNLGIGAKIEDEEIEQGDYVTSEYWQTLSKKNNQPILRPCRLFFVLSYYILRPQDMVRCKDFWFDFHHVNQILNL